MKYGILCLLLLAPVFARAERLPNIVYILCDDLGVGDVQCLSQGRGKIPTPNLDRLAREGMSFTDAHSGSAVCTPTRYGILTGRYAWRTRLQKSVLEGYASPLIAPHRLTVPALLRSNGYHTACIGKWHLGMGLSQNPEILKIENGPVTRGFDHFFGISASLDMPPFTYLEDDRVTVAPTAKKTWLRTGPAAPDFEAEEVLDALAQKAVSYIAARAATDQPFFLYLPLTSPHTPILPTPDWKGKSRLGNYGDFVMQTDDVVGRVMRSLETAGCDRNTLLIFTSDNGCSPAAQIDNLEKQGHFASAGFRGHKADLWEGGHRVPHLVRWPARVKGGTCETRTICLTDLFATCAELVGARLPEDAGEDSVSLLPLLLQRADVAPRPPVIHHSIQGAFALRDGPWKILFGRGSCGWSKGDTGTEAGQLYHMDQDPAEQVNLYGREPERVAELTKKMEAIIQNGRSTPGPLRTNDVPVVLWKTGKKAG